MLGSNFCQLATMTTQTNNVAAFRMRLNPVPSPEQLAAKVGCSDEQIRKLERGFSNPGLVIARKIAAALGAPLDEVFPPARGKKGRAA